MFYFNVLDRTQHSEEKKKTFAAGDAVDTVRDKKFLELRGLNGKEKAGHGRQHSGSAKRLSGLRL